MAEELKPEEEIERLTKIIEEKPEDIKAYLKRGNTYYKLDENEKAIQDYSKAIELNPEYAKTYYNRGNTFVKLNKFEIAIQDYNKAIELEPNNEKALFFKAITLTILKKNEEAISCFDKISDKSGLYLVAQYYKGQALGSLKQLEEAILCFDKIPVSNNRYFDAQYFKGISFFLLKQIENAVKSFVNAKKESFDILREFSDLSDSNEIEDVISKMLDYNKNDFFNVTIRHEQFNDNERNDYKKIYINALKIIVLLHVENNNETSIAHYTKRATAAALLFSGKSKFRLNSTITANDPQEGETLLKYLKLEESEKPKDKEPQDKDMKHDYQAFIGCFTFNHESLNQFRLYGKESDKEATGISLVLNDGFFNKKANIGLISNCFLKDSNKENSSTRDERAQKYALYRCIYVDPETHKIISLGHKEEYSFYREFKEIPEEKIKKDIEDYNKSLDEIKTKVNECFDKLSHCIEDAINKELDKDIICELLLPLRYLVKHVAYKEEQECRIFDVKDLKEDKFKEKDKREVKFTTDFAQMYIDYQPITDYVKKIFFAPKTEGVEIFEKALEQEGLKIECEISSHPFS